LRRALRGPLLLQDGSRLPAQGEAEEAAQPDAAATS